MAWATPKLVHLPMTAETERTDGGEEPFPPGVQPRNLMGEHNPDEWDPEPQPDYFSSGTVNIWDPIEGEGYDEPGHWADRDPDMDVEHARKLALRGEFDDLDEDQPLPLVRSDMRGVPTEGVQGTYATVTRLKEPCPECTQDYGVNVVHTMAGVHSLKCLTCGHVISQG